MPSESELKASCLCGTNTFLFNFPNSVLPFKCSLCHCSACRHISGNLLMQYAEIPLPQADAIRSIVNSPNLIRYESSTNVFRYFCATCGCHMFWDSKNSPTVADEVAITAGCMDQVEGFIEVKTLSHIFLSDTIDGGVLRHMTEQHLPQYARLTADGVDFIVPDTSTKPKASKIKGRCHCSAIQFDLFSPSAEINQAPKSSWHTNGKWHAVHCLCTSCRKATGVPLQSWAFVPATHLRFDSRSLSALRRYTSSPDIERAFCGTCGATVTFTDQKRPWLLDLSVGLLEGATPLAEEMFNWDPALLLGFVEDSVDRWWISCMKGVHEGGMLDRVICEDA